MVSSANSDVKCNSNSLQSSRYRGKYSRPVEIIKSHEKHRQLVAKRDAQQKALVAYQALLEQVRP